MTKTYPAYAGAPPLVTLLFVNADSKAFFCVHHHVFVVGGHRRKCGLCLWCQRVVQILEFQPAPPHGERGLPLFVYMHQSLFITYCTSAAIQQRNPPLTIPLTTIPLGPPLAVRPCLLVVVVIIVVVVAVRSAE